MRVDGLDLAAAHHLDDLDVALTAQLSHDMLGSAGRARVVHEREHGLDGAGVRVVVFRAQHEDGSGSVGVHDRQVVAFDGAARSTDDPDPARLADPGADGVFHLDLVLLGQHDDARPGRVLVGLDELVDDGEHLGGPSEDQVVTSLGHDGSPFAQLLDFVLDAASQQADEQADDTDTGEGEGQHQGEEAVAALVAAHGAGVERAHQTHPRQM